MAIIANASFKYVKLANKKTNHIWIVAECRLDYLLTETRLTREDVEIIETLNGSQLGGLTYKPLFNFLHERSKTLLNSYKVLLDDMVTMDTGNL